MSEAPILVPANLDIVVSMNFSHVAKSGGVADVADNLVSALREHLGARLTVVRPSRRSSRFAQVLLRYLGELKLELRYWRRNAIVLFPNYFIFPLPFSRLRRVVVVHDLQFKHYPRYTGIAKRWMLESSYRCVRRFADGVVFISQATEADFLRFYGAPRRHTVISNPVHVPDAVAWPPSRRYPYAIANFHYYPHKNIAGLLACFGALRARWPDLHLILTGHRPKDFEQVFGIDAAAASGIEHGIEHLGFVDKAEVYRLVSHSQFFISLSQFEGFNMSAAEAALLRKPLVLSDIAVHRELFADCAVLLPSPHPEQHADLILRHLSACTDSLRDSEWSLRSQVAPAVVARKYINFMVSVAGAADRN